MHLVFYQLSFLVKKILEIVKNADQCLPKPNMMSTDVQCRTYSKLMDNLGDAELIRFWTKNKCHFPVDAD